MQIQPYLKWVVQYCALLAKEKEEPLLRGWSHSLASILLVRRWFSCLPVFGLLYEQQQYLSFSVSFSFSVSYSPARFGFRHCFLTARLMNAVLLQLLLELG